MAAVAAAAAEASEADVEKWETIKNEANAEMRLGGYVPALGKYETVLQSAQAALEALEAVDSAAASGNDGTNDSGDLGPRLRSVVLACLNNASMAYLRLDRFDNCVRACSDGIALDGGNLKARYRRASAYFRLAHGECAPDRITYTTTEAEAASDDYWPLAMADVVSILEREPESAQAKALKKQIREGRTDQKRQRDLIRKYGRTLVDIPDAPGSVFQGFPAPPPADMRAKEAAAAATTTTNAPMRAAGPSMGGDKQERAQLQRAYETTVARDLAAGSLEGSSKDVLGNGSATTRGEAERQAAVRAELASAAGGAGVSFLDPMWKPPGQEAVGSGTTALLVPVASTRTAAAVAGSPAAAAAGVSFKDLLKGAADRKGKSKGKGDKSKDRKTLQPSAEVQSSLAALQEAEAAAAQAVERAAKDRELLAAQRARGNSRLERKSEQMQQEQRRLKKAPEVSSAWAELMQGESAAQNSYKQKVLSRPGGQVNLTS